ncbi:uncharacterized protein LOC120705499 isoform X3 [Panicum virgatum]|uniref:uncharacterized protein LOC120705499 isoform X3 n=1 Tax=Panicum virgatum TaxID=38727 RepID=UPI0019D56BE2|nr:uncharacterized protein LOC120705499 isoform X3 [Panicum virgatum]
MGDRDFACCFLCIKSILLHLVMLQDTDSIPTEIAVSLSEKKIGFRLDNADLVLVPLRKYSFWYLLVANFRDKRFEVICPFKNIDIIQSDAFNVICKFRKVFKAVHSKSSRLDIYDMPTVFGSVSNQINHNDSGVFVLKLLLSYDGKTHFHFKEEHAKVLRESITYYLCTHEENELILPKIKYIAQQHRIEVDNYKCRTKRISKK